MSNKKLNSALAREDAKSMTAEEVTNFCLNHLGFEKKGNFLVNPLFRAEDSPDTQSSKHGGGLYKHSTGEYIDLFNVFLIVKYGGSFHLKYIEEWFKLRGITTPTMQTVSSNTSPTKEFNAKEDKESYIEYLSKNFFSPSHHNRAMEIAKGLFRGASESEIRKAVSLLKIGFRQGKGDYLDTLYIPKPNLDSKFVGAYSFNREYKTLKGFATAGFEKKNAPKPAFPSILTPSYTSKVVVWAEGMTDAALLIAKGIQSITEGGAGSSIQQDTFEVLKGKTVLDFPDADLAGLEGAIKRNLQIVEFNKSQNAENQIKHIVFWWAKSFASVSYLEKVIDRKIQKNSSLDFALQEGAKRTKDGKGLKVDLDTLQKVQYRLLEKRGLAKFEDGQYIVPSDILLVNDFKVVLKKHIVKAGFDFTDMINKDSVEKETLLSYLKKVASL